MEPFWWLTKDGDCACLAMYERHYPPRRYRDGRRVAQFVGPGQTFVLRSDPALPLTALFVWRKFLDDCIDERTGQRQEGVNCAVYRDERGRGAAPRQSELVRQADAIADLAWPDRRHYTYVNPKRIASGLPGACFLAAGWRYVRVRDDEGNKHRARTKAGLLILERIRGDE